MRNCSEAFHKFIFPSSFIVVCFALLSLLGWYFNLPVVQAILLDNVPMHPLTGLMLLFGVLSLYGIIKEKTKLHKLILPFSFVILMVATLRFLQLLGITSFRLDLFLFGEPILPVRLTGIPRGMAPNTAFNLIIISVSLICLKSNNPKHNNLAHILAILSAFASIICVIGYIYGSELFYRYSTFLPMALSTALCIFLINICILLMKTDRTFMNHISSDRKGGQLARMLLPFSFFLPVFIGWLFVYNVQHKNFLFNYSMALFAFSMMLLLIAMIWMVATRVNRSEGLMLIEIKRRERAEEELKKRMEAILLTEQVRKQKELVRTAIKAQEKERKDIGMDLHDNINQILTSIKLMLEMAGQDKQYRDEFLKKASQSVNLCISEIRTLSKALVPPKIDDSNLKDAVSDLLDSYRNAKGAQIEMIFPEVTMLQLSEEQGLAMFRIIQEQMNNIVRHAEASLIRIKVWQRSNMVYLRIQDNGKGFDTSAKKKGIGLSNMDNRAQMLQGQLYIQSRPGRGCILELSFPLSVEEIRQ